MSNVGKIRYLVKYVILSDVDICEIDFILNQCRLIINKLFRHSAEGKFYKGYLSNQSLKLGWELLILNFIQIPGANELK